MPAGADPSYECGAAGGREHPPVGRPAPYQLPRVASAWLNVCDGRMTAAALATEGW